MSNLFKSLLKETGNEFASAVEDGTDADVDGYVDRKLFVECSSVRVNLWWNA